MNVIAIKGRLTADPEYRQTPSNIAVCRFTVAVDKYTKDNQRAADFIRCTAWRATAEFISKYFTKGKEIAVTGSLHNSDYTDSNGVKHFSYDVQVDKAEFCGGKTETAPAPATAPASTGQIPDTQNWAEFEAVLADGEIPF